MPVAGVLLLVGAALLVVGCILPWFSVSGTDYNGFGDEAGESRDGPFFVGMAVILAAFGITLLAARRVLAVAIIAVVVASFSLIAGLADYGDVSDLTDAGFADGGPGLLVVILGSLCSLAGGIVALAKRRR